MEIFLQKQPNNLTYSRHSLNISQQRIMGRVLQQLQPEINDETIKVDASNIPNDRWLTIPVGQLVVGNNVKPLRDALSGIVKEVVHVMFYDPVDGKKVERGTTLIKEYDYKHGSSNVRVQISGALLPQLTDLARGFTQYSLDVAFNTSSPNVYKLYMFFASFRHLPTVNCNVSTLRKWLKIEDKYAMPSKIKERILVPAMKELKEKADVWFEIADRYMKGRKMVGWKFRIHNKIPVKRPKKKQICTANSLQITKKPVNISKKPKKITIKTENDLKIREKNEKIFAFDSKINKELTKINPKESVNRFSSLVKALSNTKENQK